MLLELIMYSVRKIVESKTGAKCYSTYPPKDSTCFGTQVGDDYHKFIIFTQCFEFTTKVGLPIKFYLYYRNKRTKGTPEFSSCELGMFTGKLFVSLFKEHIEQLSERDFAQLIADKTIEAIESV